MTSTSSMQLTCLCGAISTPGTLLASPEIPLDAEICHCDSCRHTTGSLGSSFPVLASAPSKEILARLTPYHSSQIITRYFCFTCGCHCFLHNHQRGRWYCLAGIIEPAPAPKGTDTSSRPEDVVRISQHDYVLDTVDGGLIPFLLNLTGRAIPTWSAGAPIYPDSVPFDLPHTAVLSLPSKALTPVPQPELESYLPAKCRCGAVSLLIKRADFTPGNKVQISERTNASDPTKYLSYLCACRSCRLSTGVSLTPWTTVPPSRVFNASTPSRIDDSHTVPSDAPSRPMIYGYDVSKPDANPGQALKHYWSSSDVCRSFCETCGATVSYWCGQRPDEIDLAVGILRGEEGSMARRWLQWEWGRCSFPEEAVDSEMYHAWAQCAELMQNLTS